MHKAAKWLALPLAGTLLLGLLAAGGLYWRLRQGPMNLAMLTPYLQRALDEAVAPAGLKVRFRGVVLEVSDDGLPTLRLKDVTLRSRDNRLVTAAPQAALGFSGRALLKGRLAVRRLGLEGPKLQLRRGGDGAISVDFGTTEDAGAAFQAPISIGKADLGVMRPSSPGSSGISGRELFAGLDALLRQGGDSTSGQLAGKSGGGGLEALEIRRAEIVLVDEKLGVRWQASAANLTLRSVPYGYALLAKAEVRGVGRPWRVELSANWRRKTSHIGVSLRLQDMNLSDVLSSFSAPPVVQAQLPLSGHLDFELDGNASLLTASGELMIGRGQIMLPEYLVRPVQVRQGILRLEYRPAEKAILLREGQVLTHVGRFGLSGLVRMVPGPQGGVQALDAELAMRHDEAPASNRGRGGFPWRHARLQMRAWLQQGNVEIGDLQLFAPEGAVRLHGALRREKEGVGIYISGRARDISHELLKASWPVKIGAGVRRWIGENVHAGRITRATFRLAMPAQVLRAAIEHGRPLPEEVADVRFDLAGVRFTYVRGWPAIGGAAGQGVMTGNSFRLSLSQGGSRLPSGRSLSLLGGELRVQDLAARVKSGEIRVQAKGRAEAFLELADLPPLRLVRDAGLSGGELSGDATASLHLRLPFSQGMTGAGIRVLSFQAKVDKAAIRGLLPGPELTAGTLALTYANGLLRAAGKGRVAGLPVRFEWQRRFGPGAAKGETAPKLVLRTTLDDATRKRLGMDLSAWMRGPITVQAEARLVKGAPNRFHIRAGLDKVHMKLPAIGWRRPAQKGTKASFDLILGGGKGFHIRRLSLSGPGGLRITGKVTLDADGNFREAVFSRFELNPDNRLALGLTHEGRRLQAQAAGLMFDARPLITRLFAPRRELDRSLSSVFMRVNIREVLALRGERIRDVRGELELVNGLVRRASLTGRFASSGERISLDLVPASGDLRRLRIITNDAGSLLRAAGLYSRIIGGRAEFTALLKSGADGGVQRGLLVVRDFIVRGDDRLRQLRQESGGRGVKLSAGGPWQGHRFKKLVLPFSTDRHFIRIGDALIRSPEIGATANGLIRRADGAMDIGGVIIPVYALNAALGKIPVVGLLLTGGKGQGVFGMTYALKGTIRRPKFMVNPLSAVAPGVLRHFFHLGGNQVNPDGTPRQRNSDKTRRRSRTNLTSGG